MISPNVGERCGALFNWAFQTARIPSLYSFVNRSCFQRSGYWSRPYYAPKSFLSILHGQQTHKGPWWDAQLWMASRWPLPQHTPMVTAALILSPKRGFVTQQTNSAEEYSGRFETDNICVDVMDENEVHAENMIVSRLLNWSAPHILVPSSRYPSHLRWEYQCSTSSFPIQVKLLSELAISHAHTSTKPGKADWTNPSSIRHPSKLWCSKMQMVLVTAILPVK